MEILRNHPESLTKRDMYRLTNSVTMQKMSAAEGSQIHLDKWVLFTDTDAKTGEIQKVLAIESNGELFATISKTFIENFEKAADFFDDDLGDIRVIGGQSKAGRSYITCEIV